MSSDEELIDNYYHHASLPRAKWELIDINAQMFINEFGDETGKAVVTVDEIKDLIAYLFTIEEDYP